MLASLKRFSASEIAQYREKATKEAFKVDRKLVYVWRKRLNSCQGKVSSLIPLSTAPRKVRQMEVHLNITGWGKKRLNPYLMNTAGKTTCQRLLNQLLAR